MRLELAGGETKTMPTAPTVIVLLSLMTAAERFDMRYDAVVKAVRSGRLRVRYAAEKPGGDLQPLVAERDIERFRANQLAAYRNKKSPYLRKRLEQMRRADVRVPRVSLDDVLRPRKSRNGKPRGRSPS